MIRRTAVAACALVVALTGCEALDELELVAESAPTYTVEATCDTFTLELDGWPEDTILIYGIGADPPYGTSPGNSANGARTAPVAAYNVTDGEYGWAVLIDSPDDTRDVDVSGVVAC